MSRVLVIAALGGIGSSMATAFAARGMAVTSLSRSVDGLDVTDEASIARYFGVLDAPFSTILVASWPRGLVASGALEIGGIGPEKSLRALDPTVLTAQFALNAIGPALMLKHALRLIPCDQPARLAVLSARVASMSDNALGGYAYRVAKAALNQLIHAADVIALRAADRVRDIIVMAEGTYAPHHPQKIALILTAMRKFAAELRADGWGSGPGFPCHRGGQWNFDSDNRKPAKPDLFRARPPQFAPDAEPQAALPLVESRLRHHFGQLRPFIGPPPGQGRISPRSISSSTRCRCLAINRTPCCNPTHRNIGLLSPLEICHVAKQCWPRATPF